MRFEELKKDTIGYLRPTSSCPFPFLFLLPCQGWSLGMREEGPGQKASPAGGGLTVLGGQHSAHRGKEFVQRGVHGGCEISRVVASQGHQQAVAQELEVDRIHTQFVGMQVAQSGQGTRQVFDVVCSFGQGISNLLAVSLDLGRAGAYINVREVGLGGGEGSEHPL